MISNKLKVRGSAKEYGLATVEMAIALPVLLAMLLLTAEFTRVLYQYNTLTKSVRDGSRFLSSQSLTGQQPELSNISIETAKKLVMSGLPQGGTSLLNGFTTDDISVDVNESETSGATRYYVTVTAVYGYVPLIGSLGGLGFLPGQGPLNFNLTALSSMRAR